MRDDCVVCRAVPDYVLKPGTAKRENGTGGCASPLSLTKCHSLFVEQCLKVYPLKSPRVLWFRTAEIFFKGNEEMCYADRVALVISSSNAFLNALFSSFRGEALLIGLFHVSLA